MPAIEFFKLDILPPRGFSDKEVSLFMDKAQAKDDMTMYNFLFIFLNTGLRLTELRYLKWEDVDFVAKQLIVKKSKSHNFRVIPLMSDLENHLFQLKRQSMVNQVYLFEKSLGEAQTENFYYRRFNRLVVSLNIKGCIHSLRHTFASRLVQRGVSLYHVQQLLGHSTIKTTERYARLRPIDLANAVKVLESHGTVTEPSQNNLLKLA